MEKEAKEKRYFPIPKSSYSCFIVIINIIMSFKFEESKERNCKRKSLNEKYLLLERGEVGRG